MGKGINKVILLGNLGQDPEVRHLPDGTAVANFSLATSESWKDKQTGQPVEKTEWHKCSVFGRLAEVCGEYLRKGSKVYIEGSIHTRKYQDKQDGSDRYSTEIKVKDMQMLDGKPADERNHGTHQNPQGGQGNYQGGYNNQQGGSYGRR